MDAEVIERPSMQLCFRNVGMWLDEQSPARITLIESTTGFLLIRTETSTQYTRTERQVGFEEKISFAENLTTKVTWRWRTPGRRGTSGGSPPSQIGYARILETLGRMLDETRAHAILVDELEDGLLVGYSFLDATRGYLWRRHTTQITFEQIAAMVNER